MQVAENAAAPAVAPPPAIVETPAAPAPEVAKPEEAAPPATPEARDSALTDELSAVWDKQLTNGVEKDEKGRFVSNKPKDEAPTNSADQPQAVTPEPAKPAIEAPLSWSAEARAHWAKLPPEAQTYIAQREGEAHKAITSQGERLKTYEPFEGVLNHYKEDLSRRGVQPAHAVAMLFEAQRKLDANPLDGLVNIGLTYGIDLRPLLSGNPNAPVSGPDPRVQTLEQKINTLEQQLSARRQQEEAQVLSMAQTHVTEFQKDKPYFEEVRPMMAALLSSEQAKDLNEAYDMATHANKSIRERILTDQRKADEAQREKEAKARAEEARKSGKVNVRSGTAQPTPKTMDDDIEEIARRHYG